MSTANIRQQGDTRSRQHLSLRQPTAPLSERLDRKSVTTTQNAPTINSGRQAMRVVQASSMEAGPAE